MGPDVEGLIGELKEAEDAISGWTARVSVAGDDAVLMENLRVKKKQNLVRQFNRRCVVHEDGCLTLAQVTNKVSSPCIATSLFDPRCRGKPRSKVVNLLSFKVQKRQTKQEQQQKNNKTLI